MTDWVTISALATAGGTLVLATATFASVRSGNRAARIAEQALILGQRPLVMPSRLDDPPEKVMWSEAARSLPDHWAHVDGGRASVELVDGTIYLAMSLRNVGNGTGVLQGWRVMPRPPDRAPEPEADPSAYRRQLRDLYVPSGDVGFWQGAIRDPSDEDYAWLSEAIAQRSLFMVALLYTDHEGAQRAIGTFALAPGRDEQWMNSVILHRNLDRPNPR